MSVYRIFYIYSVTEPNWPNLIIVCVAFINPWFTLHVLEPIFIQNSVFQPGFRQLLAGFTENAKSSTI